MPLSNGIRIGIVILPEFRWPEARTIWARAEAYGFDHAWTYDHLAWRSLADGPWFGTIPTLTAAATATSRIRLGTFVASPNFKHPVPFAKDLMTVDDISDGRLIVGIGAGGTGVDATVLGGDVLPPRERAGRLEEFVGLLDDLLTNASTTTHGERFTAVDARMIPGTVQQPRPPFVIAANGPRLMRLAIERGQGWATIGGMDDGGTVESWWDGVAALAERFDDLCDEQERARGSIQRYLSVDSSGLVALSSVDYFDECVGRASDLGFTDVVIHWPRPDGVYAASESVLEAVASRLVSV